MSKKWHEQKCSDQYYSKKKNPKNLKTIQMSVNRMNVIIYSSIQQNTMVVENNQYTAYNHMDKPHRCYIAWKKPEII